MNTFLSLNYQKIWKSPIAVVMAYLHEEGLNSKKKRDHSIVNSAG